MTPEEYRRAEAQARARAAWHRMQSAKADLDLAALRAAKTMEAFTAGWLAGERWAFEEHPDVQESVAQMRGFFE